MMSQRTPRAQHVATILAADISIAAMPLRLFVAVNLPSDIRERLWRCSEPLRCQGYRIRWVSAASLHMTLKFLGDVQDERERAVIAAVDAAVTGSKPFLLPIESLGVFPSPGRARVVLVGCKAVPPLGLIQQRLECQMEMLGLTPEARTFRPHITLGRVRRGVRASDLKGLNDCLEQIECSSAFTVQTVDLMRSDLGRSGPRYTRRHSAKLVH